MRDYIYKATILLDRKLPQHYDNQPDWPAGFDRKHLDNLLGISFQAESGWPRTKCRQGSLSFITLSPNQGQTYNDKRCIETPPFVRIVTIAYDLESNSPYLLKNIILDGYPVEIELKEFDPMFYLNFINKFINSLVEFLRYLQLFSNSFKTNNWFRKTQGVWLLWLFNFSKWKTNTLKQVYAFYVVQHGLDFLMNEEFRRVGFLPILSVFDVKYAKTSINIVTHVEVAVKLKEKMAMSKFISTVNNLFKQQANSDFRLLNRISDGWRKDWRPNVNLKNEIEISLCQVNRFCEFEAKKRIIQTLIRDIENDIRIEKGYSVVGGMIRETILYRELKKYYSNYSVISQYQPKWLGRQSLDIYIEELHVGIEYQGEQHVRPIEFFGGKAAFKKTKKRDQAKLKKCRLNGCKLIYVYPGFSLEGVINQIQKNGL